MNKISRQSAHRDFDYEHRRNKLITFAVTEANNIHGAHMPVNGRDRLGWAGAWNQTYFRAMDRMAVETGLMK